MRLRKKIGDPVSPASWILLLGFLFSTQSYSQSLTPLDPKYDSLKASGFFQIPDQVTPTGYGTGVVLPPLPSSANSPTLGLLIPRDASFIQAMGRNDDGSTGSISFPFNFEFYSSVKTSCYINNNGNVSFGGAYTSYTSTGFPVNGYPMLSPFWADVDTRPAESGLVYYKVESHRVTVIWESVGYFNLHIDKKNTFELIFTDGTDPLIGIGNNVAFSYEDMQWTTGDYSNGSGGFGGVASTVGINKGDGVVYALIGRFDHAGSDYDGPSGDNDGVSYLDDKLFLFNTGTSVANIPPVPAGFPLNTINLSIGDTLIDSVQFLSPEAGQITTTTANPGLLTGFSYQNTPGQVSNTIYTLIGGLGNIGSWLVNFVAIDNGTPPLSSTSSILFSINDAPPEITSVADTTTMEDAPYLYNVEAIDPDSVANDTLVFQLLAHPIGMQINPRTGIITWLPTNSDVGFHQVSIRVADIAGMYDIQQFMLNVVNVNDPPVANAGPDQIVNYNSVVTLNGFSSYDIDGDSLAFEWIAPPGILLMNPFSVNPTFSVPFLCSPASYIFTLTVNDGFVTSAPDQVVITSRHAYPGISVFPVSISDTLMSGTSSIKTLLIKNPGVCPLNVTISEPVTWLSVTPSSSSVNPGDSATFSVIFNATNMNIGIYSTQLTITSNDPNHPVVHIPVSMKVNGIPNIAVNPLSLNFGSVYIGQNVIRTLNITNTGTAELIISDISVLDPQCASNITNLTLPPGSNQILNINYQPDTNLVLNSTLVISSNDPDQGNLVVGLTGQGLYAPNIFVNPDLITDTLIKNTYSAVQMIIANNGDGNLIFNLHENVSWLTVWPGSGTVEPDSVVIIDLSLNSNSINPGNYSTILTVNCNDPGSPVITVPVNMVVLAPLSVSVTSNPGAVCIGGSVLLSASTSGGYGNYSFNWISEPPGFSSTEQNPLVTPLVSTTYMVTVSDGHSAVTASVTVVLFTNESPSPVSNMLPVDGSVGLPLPILLSWAPSINALSYDIFIWAYNSPRPAVPVVANFSQINYLFSGGEFSYGDTCKWQVVAKNPCFQAPGAIQFFVIRGLPDLHITNVQTSAALAGHPMTISWTVKNDGNAETPAGTVWLDRVWITPDIEVRVGEPEDILLGQYQNMSYLAPGETYTQTVQVQMPANLIGNYFIFVITDDLDALFIDWPPSGPPLPYAPPPYYTSYSHGGSSVQEYSEHDNFFYKEISFAIPPLPDLQVTSVIGPTNIFSGQPATITWTVKNKGDGNTNTGNWSDRIWFSADTLFNPSTAVNLGTFAHTGILNPDSSYMMVKQISIPANIFGTFYFFIQTDIGNAIFEHVYENNNMSRSDSLSVYLTPPPDLVVTQISAPDTLSNCDDFTIGWMVHNQGATAPVVTSWYDGVYLSVLPNFNPANAINLGSTSINEVLLPDSSYFSQKTNNLSQNISGSYYIYVKTDINDNVFEYVNENNNILRSDTSITIINPDLIVNNIVIPSVNSNSQPVNVQWTIKNSGPGKVYHQSWKDIVLVGSTPVYDPELLVQVAELNHSNETLLHGESISQSLLITIPDSLSGLCYIYIFADWSNSVYENNDTNNLLRSSQPLNIYKPDLVVSNIIIPQADSTGLPVDISWQVTNSGQGAVYNRNWTDRILLSYSPNFNVANAIQIASLNYDATILPGASVAKEMFVALPDSFPGPYYIYIQVDCNDVVFENQSEANNTGRSQSVIQVLRPDLAAKHLIIPATGLSGDSIIVRWTDKNIGNVAILNKSWIDRIFLSNQLVFNPNTANILGEKVNIGSLYAGDSLKNQLSIIIPDGIQDLKYIHVYTDFLNDIPENVHEINNLITSSIQITPGPWVDLQVMGITINDTTVAGSNIPVTFNIRNIGNKSLSNKSWADKVYLSESPVWSPGSAIFLRTFIQTGDLNINADYTTSSTINLPSVLTNGNYYIYIFTDADSSIYENASENNNILRSDTIFISALPPVDLAITNLMHPDSANSGQPITIQWSVMNLSNSLTIGSWYDAVYLSIDSIWDKNGDIMIGKRLHIGALNQGMNYHSSQVMTVPNGISGNYYLLTVTDYEQINNDENLLNNYKGMTGSGNSMQIFHITLTPPPDLIVTSLSMPNQVFTGVPFTTSWVVKNSGTGNTGTNTWTDKIYLSTDFTINNGDILIGTKTRTGALGIGQTYNDSLLITLPNNLSGNYIMLVKTDFENSIYELNENNNTKYSFVVIAQPPPADLFVSSVSLPLTVLVGENTTMQWSLKNIGQNPANGTVKDMVYFSSDPIWDMNDILFGIYQSTLTLGSGNESLRTLTAKVLDLPIGQYYVIIRTDVMNSIFETNESNNISVSSRTLFADVRLLPLGILTADTLSDFENLYFRIPVADSLNNETMLTTLKADSTNGMNEMYLRDEAMPSRIVYDFTSGNPYRGNQEIIVPSVSNGNYYMLVYGSTIIGNQQNVSVLAQILNFEIRSVDPPAGGNSGQVTLKIDGSKFDPSVTVRLENGGIQLTAGNLIFIDYSRIYATFDLSGIPPGVFDVVVQRTDGEVVTLDNGFEVVPGIPPNLSVNVIAPPAARQNRVTSFIIEFANLGNTDLINPEAMISSQTISPIALSIEELANLYHQLVIPLKEEYGPLGILRPGVVGAVTVYTKTTAGLGFIIKY